MINTDSGSGLLSDGTKPLPEPVLNPPGANGFNTLSPRQKVAVFQDDICNLFCCMQSVVFSYYLSLFQTKPSWQYLVISLGTQAMNLWLVIWQHQAITWTNVESPGANGLTHWVQDKW